MNDHYIIPLFVAGSLMLTLLGFFLIAYVLVQKRKQIKHKMEKQQMLFDYENNLLKVKIEEQENTMDQISKELHDNIKSVLGFVQMSMYRISDSMHNAEQSKQLDKLNATVGQVIDDLHNISHSLNSSLIKSIGVVESITKDLENIRVNKGITYNIEIKGNNLSLSPEKELHVYRIAQEIIQNCMKHAKATSINIYFCFEPDVFIMRIADNGVGFDKNKVFEMKGLGFINMFQRARYVNGNLDIHSVHMEGTSITLKLDTYDKLSD